MKNKWGLGIGYLALLLSGTLYVLGYHAFWNFSNMEPWLSKIYNQIAVFFSGKSEPVSDFTLIASSNGVIYEDSVIFETMILSIIFASLAIVLGAYSRKVFANKKHVAVIIPLAFLIIVMDVLFLNNNSLRI